MKILLIRIKLHIILYLLDSFQLDDLPDLHEQLLLMHPDLKNVDSV